jgi:multidrug efflux pump subunit AcrA (membrane-fusion protein)
MANQFRITSVIQRKITTVAYPATSEDLATYQQINYINTGKIVSKETHLSPDNLSKTLLTTFASVADYEAYKADETIKASITARDQYLIANGMTLNLLFQEIDSSGTPLNTRVVKLV